MKLNPLQSDYNLQVNFLSKHLMLENNQIVYLIGNENFPLNNKVE